MTPERFLDAEAMYQELKAGKAVYTPTRIAVMIRDLLAEIDRRTAARRENDREE